MNFGDFPPTTTGGHRRRMSIEQESNLALMHDTIMEQILSGENASYTGAGVGGGGNNMNDAYGNDSMTLDSAFPSRDLLGDAGDELNLHAQDQLPAVDEYIMNNMSMRGGMGNNSTRGIGSSIRGLGSGSTRGASTRGTGSRRGGYSRDGSLRGIRSNTRQSIIGLSASLAGITPATMAAHSAQAKRHQRIRSILSILGVIGVCLSFMMIGVFIGKSKSNTSSTTGNNVGTIGTNGQTTTSDSNGNPTNIALGSDRYNAAVTLIRQLGITTDPSAFVTTDTPQSKAVYWLTTTDEMNIDILDTIQFRQRYVLAVVYYALDGPNWTTSFKFLSSISECSWNEYWSAFMNNYTDNRPDLGDNMDQFNIGILCDQFNPYITKIYLPSAKLTGQLPNEIVALTNLTELNLYNNELSNTIPNSYQALTNLKALVLHQNELHDVIPMWLGNTLTNLEIINLGDNDIFGTIPSNINQLTNLKTLNCESCLLGGSLSSLMNMKSLETIHLGQNTIKGEFTNELFNSLISLKEIDLGQNLFTGELPTNLFNNTQMLIIDLHSNQFIGDIPYVNPDNMIRSLAINDNDLSGRMDTLIKSLNPKIQHLDLSKNEFTGSGLPTDIGLLTDLKYLFIAMNPNLNKEIIPSEIGLLTELIDISLQNTNRIGEIPYTIKNNKLLITLDLINNYITGDIPDELSMLKQLRFLLLRGNELTGDIPPTFSQLKELDTLLIDNNNNIDSGSNHICRLKHLRRFQADCQPFITECTCCTLCCDEDDNASTCQTEEYFSNFDPTAEYHYVRKFYKFNDNDIVFPVKSVPQNELPLYFENSQGQHAIDNPLYGSPLSFVGPFEYSPFDYQTNNENVANPFEEYQEDKEYAGEDDVNGDTDEEYYYNDEDNLEKFGDVIDPWDTKTLEPTDAP